MATENPEQPFQQQQQFHNNPMYKMQEDLPNSGGILAMGIISIVFAGLIGLILSIITLSMASNARRLYNEEPDRYTQSSLSKVNAGRVCAIIGMCLLLLVLLVIVGVAAAS